MFGHAVLPVVNIQEKWTDQLLKNITERMLKANQLVQDKDNVYSTSPQLALATDEELETVNTYATTVETYSKELLTNLILGRESMDNWGTYIAKLKDLGLDKLIEVYQAQHDRFMNN